MYYIFKNQSFNQKENTFFLFLFSFYIYLMLKEIESQILF